VRARLLGFAGVTLVLGLVELAGARYLAATDAIATLLALRPLSIAALLAMFSARLGLYLVIPGWGVYLVVLWLWSQRRAPPDPARPDPLA
jgi:hypothetical protein